MFSSAKARLPTLTGEFCDALIHSDAPHLGYTTARIFLIVGEVIVLHLAVHLLDQGVSFVYFCLSHWLNAWHVAGRFDTRSRLTRSGDSSGGRRGATPTVMAVMSTATAATPAWCE